MSEENARTSELVRDFPSVKYQGAQVCVDLWPTYPGTGSPTPVAAEAGTMPTHEGLWLDDRDRAQDRWKLSVQLDEEPPISICELEATAHLPPQHGQLMSKRCVLRLKPALRLERRGQQRKQEAKQGEHRH
jgi:hypothetical protein